MCFRCLMPVYLVQNARGEQMLVDHLGRVTCPAGRPPGRG